MNPWALGGVVVLLVVLSAFFSGMETAFVGSNKLKLAVERRQSLFFNFAAGQFMRHSGQFITTMLVGNNVVLVLYSLAVSSLFGAMAGYNSTAIETILATVVIIFLGEYIPKSVVLGNPNFYFRTFAALLWVVYIVLWPVARLTALVSSGVIRLFGHRADANTDELFSRAELVNLLGQQGAEEPDHEVLLLQNALEFPDLVVRDCMVQRINIEAIEATGSIEELTRRFVETQYSRIFVWRGSIDNIVGYVGVKSLFLEPASIESVLKKVDYVPETMPVQELMDHFIRSHSSMAVVIDEFGGTAGVVSLEDILEEIFGEIEDEHDTTDLVEKQLGAGEWIFSCQLEVDYLNEKWGLEIPESSEYDTLAGYVIFNFGDIPPQGEVMTIGRHQITIVRRTSARIELARVKMV